jgi:flagellar assembly factor FliW
MTWRFYQVLLDWRTAPEKAAYFPANSFIQRMILRTIQTTRFGQLEIEEERVVHFPEGLLGFPDHKDYVILQHRKNSPFCWLQSMSAPDLAFVMTDPLMVKKDYLQYLSPDEKESLRTENGHQLAVFALVSIPSGHVERMTVNLLGPLVIDTSTRTGKQVILIDSGYSHQYPLISR